MADNKNKIKFIRGFTQRMKINNRTDGYKEGYYNRDYLKPHQEFPPHPLPNVPIDYERFINVNHIESYKLIQYEVDQNNTEDNLSPNQLDHFKYEITMTSGSVHALWFGRPILGFEGYERTYKEDE